MHFMVLGSHKLFCIIFVGHVQTGDQGKSKACHFSDEDTILFQKECY